MLNEHHYFYSTYQQSNNDTQSWNMHSTHVTSYDSFPSSTSANQTTHENPMEPSPWYSQNNLTHCCVRTLENDYACYYPMKQEQHRSSLSIHDLFEKSARDLNSNSSTISSIFETLFQYFQLPWYMATPIDYSSLYMNALLIWKHQFKHLTHQFENENPSFHQHFALFLCLFYLFMTIGGQQGYPVGNASHENKLVQSLQEEIHRFTKTNSQLACRLKALFMKSYVTLAQSYSHC